MIGSILLSHVLFWRVRGIVCCNERIVENELLFSHVKS